MIHDINTVLPYVACYVASLNGISPDQVHTNWHEKDITIVELNTWLLRHVERQKVRLLRAVGDEQHTLIHIRGGY